MAVVPLRADENYYDENGGNRQNTDNASPMERIGESIANFFGRLGSSKRNKDPQFGLMGEVLAMNAMGELRNVLGDSHETMHDIETTRHAMQHYIDSKRVVLSQELTKPSWGPKIAQRDFKRGKKKIGRGMFNRLRSLLSRDENRRNADRSATLEPDYLMHQQDQEISFNLEQSRRYSHFLWLYFSAAIASVAIVAAALTVDYSILKEFWHQAMMNEYMMVPPELQDSVSLKALQVLFATIGIHLVLRHAPDWMVTMFTGVIFVMTVLMMIAIGFLYAHKTLPVENQATVNGESTEDSGLLGALANSGITVGSGSAREGDEETGAIVDRLSGVFDAETLAWVDAVGWLVALTAVFLVVASIGALFLLWGEHNIRNFILARDYSNRRYETARLRYAESVALQVS